MDLNIPVPPVRVMEGIYARLANGINIRMFVDLVYVYKFGAGDGRFSASPMKMWSSEKIGESRNGFESCCLTIIQKMMRKGVLCAIAGGV